MVDLAKHSGQLVEGVHSLASLYDGFVIDQWGVLHDGQAACFGAVECLRKLKRLGKAIVVLSNSGKRAFENAERLAQFGFGSDLYSSLLTSGELAWTNIKARRDPPYRDLGRHCLLIDSDADCSTVSGLDLELTTSVEKADFILVSGMDDSISPDDVEPLLARAVARELPLICANPDLLRLASGGVTEASGALALRYAATGGTVHYVGKPYPEIYTVCRERLAELGAGRILSIGDSLPHDVAGGSAAGFDTALVMSGIYRADFAGVDGDASRRAVIRRLLAEDAGAMPDWLFSGFAW